MFFQMKIFLMLIILSITVNKIKRIKEFSFNKAVKIAFEGLLEKY